MEPLHSMSDIDQFIFSGEIRLLYFSRPSCGICKALIPKIEEMLESFKGIEARYIDLDSIPEAAGQFSIFTIPGILIYTQGKETIRKARYVSVEQLRGEIDRYYRLLYV